MYSSSSALTPRANSVGNTSVATRHHILVVEDAAALRRLLTYQLQGRGFTVTVASDGNEALALVQRDGLPDLIILDVLIPGLDGVAVAQALRQQGAVPILMMSALPEAVVKLTAPLGLVDHYLPKPFTFAYLLMQVQRLLATS